jgi:hypothetical protein
MSVKRSGRIGAIASASSNAASTSSIAAPPTAWTPSDQRSRAQKRAISANVSTGMTRVPYGGPPLPSAPPGHGRRISAVPNEPVPS